MVPGSPTGFQIPGFDIKHEGPTGWRFRVESRSPIFEEDPADGNHYSDGGITKAAVRGGTRASRDLGRLLTRQPGVRRMTFAGKSTIIIELHKGRTAAPTLGSILESLRRQLPVPASA